MLAFVTIFTSCQVGLSNCLVQDSTDGPLASDFMDSMISWIVRYPGYSVFQYSDITDRDIHDVQIIYIFFYCVFIFLVQVRGRE